MLYLLCWSLCFLSLLRIRAAKLEATQVPILWQIPGAHWSGSKFSQFDFLSTTEVLEKSQQRLPGKTATLTILHSNDLPPLFHWFFCCWIILMLFSIEYMAWFSQIGIILNHVLSVATMSHFHPHSVPIICHTTVDFIFKNFFSLLSCYFHFKYTLFLCYKVRSSFNSIDIYKHLMFTKTLFCDIWHQFNNRN